MSSEKETKALTIKEETLDVIQAKLTAFQNAGEIHLPADYSAQNALKSAWLILQETVNKDKQPVLVECTKASIANSLLDMVIQGLDPAKDQCYFIAYGKRLSCQRSYFGDEILAKRVSGDISDIFAEVVYEGDEFEYEILRGKKFVSVHKQKMGNVRPDKILGAYCIIFDLKGEPARTEIMTFEEIKHSWKKSKTYPVTKDGGLKEDSTHAEFPAEMCKRTVIRKCCKPIINASSEKMLLQSVTRQEILEIEEGAKKEIDEKANRDFIDLDVEPEPEDLEPPEPPKEKPKQEEESAAMSRTRFEETVDGYVEKLTLEECRKVIKGASFGSVAPKDFSRVIDLLQVMLEEHQAKAPGEKKPGF